MAQEFCFGFGENYCKGISIIADIVQILGISGISFLLLFKAWQHNTKVVILSSSRFWIKPSFEEIKKTLWRRKMQEWYIEMNYVWAVGNSEDIKNYCKQYDCDVDNLKRNYRHISLFAVTEMPILVRIWSVLARSSILSLFRKTRLPVENQWKRKKSSLVTKISKYFIKQSSDFTASIDPNITLWDTVNLVIECSFTIDSNVVPQINVCKLSTQEPTQYNLEYKSQLVDFEVEVKKIQKILDSKIWAWGTINLFLAVPAPFAVVIGQNIHVNWPKYNIYDKTTAWNYDVALTLPL